MNTTIKVLHAAFSPLYPNAMFAMTYQCAPVGWKTVEVA